VKENKGIEENNNVQTGSEINISLAGKHHKKANKKTLKLS